MMLNLRKVYFTFVPRLSSAKIKLDFGQADPAGVKLLDPFPIFTVEEVHTV